MMNIVVADGGGRGHALAATLHESSYYTKVFVTPGTGGWPYKYRGTVATHDIEGVVRFARAKGASLVIPADDASVVGGLTDACIAAHIAAIGPCASCAKLEGSKIFMHQFCDEIGAPTARYLVAYKENFEEILTQAANQWGHIPVLKADGLSRGKGVGIFNSLSRARFFAQNFFARNPGKLLLLEERLVGWEFTSMWLCDGKKGIPLPPAADYKPISDAPEAPNTGGMGGYAPVRRVPLRLMQQIEALFVEPLLKRMRKLGTPYHGVLNLNLMVTETGVKLLEINCRFGDPELQTLLSCLKVNLTDLLFDTIHFDGLSEKADIFYTKKVSVCVVLASSGYPEDPRIGDEIFGLDEAELIAKIYHAGTQKEGNRFFTCGGRVLNVVASGRNFIEARRHAYNAAKLIQFAGKQMRFDIAARLF